MSELREAMEEYVAIRRSLGFKLVGVANELRKFVTFAEGEGATHITVDLAVRWAKQSVNAQPSTWAARLRRVRRFAIWRTAIDPRTEVPPEGVFPQRYRRKPPYIYSNEEIQKVVEAGRALPSSTGLRGLTYSTIFGLISVTGMRVGETVALDREQVDLREGIIFIHRAKFGKSRLVPVHESTCEVLAEYARERDRIFPSARSPAFFVSRGGTRVTACGIQYNFARVSGQIGLRPPMKDCRHGHGPRLHDMRHRFAVLTLLDWYRAGIDVEREIPKLAAYLGHVHVNETYWYIEAVPELLELASRRLIQTAQEVQP
jgi:integrase/recombinase XerD